MPRCTGPYGSKQILYVDYAASGRPLGRVEDFIGGVLPFYANTHTETSGARWMTVLSINYSWKRERLVHMGNDPHCAQTAAAT